MAISCNLLHNSIPVEQNTNKSQGRVCALVLHCFGVSHVLCLQLNSSAPYRFLGLSRNLSNIQDKCLCNTSFFSGSRRPNNPGQGLILSRAAPKTYNGHRNGRNSSCTVLQESSPTPGSLKGAVGAHVGASGSDTDEESVKSSSTSPTFKQNKMAEWGCHDIKKPAQAQWVAHSVRGVCIVLSSGSAQIQAANRGLSHQ
jgi:hypothetical protein